MSKLLIIYFLIKDFINKLFSTVFSFIKIVILSRKPYKKLNCSLKKTVILGNGPSLQKSLNESFDFISKSDIYCVNQFAHSEYFQILKPKYYVLHDPAYFHFDGIINVHPVVKETFDKIEEYCNWELLIFLPQIGKKSAYLKALCIRKSNIKLQFYNYTIFEGFDFLKFQLFNLKIAMPQAQNVMVASLYLALTNSAREVYLFGADHSWHENIKLTNDGLMLKDVHFYDKKEIGLRSIIDAQSNKSISMAKQFEAFSKTFRGYDVLSEYANYLNARVYNASFKTYIDAFPLIKI